MVCTLEMGLELNNLVMGKGNLQPPNVSGKRLESADLPQEGWRHVMCRNVGHIGTSTLDAFTLGQRLFLVLGKQEN